MMPRRPIGRLGDECGREDVQVLNLLVVDLVEGQWVCGIDDLLLKEK